MNYTHPFYPILIANSLYVNFFYFILYVPRRPQNVSKKLFHLGFVRRFFLSKQQILNYFCTECPKSALRGGKTIFFLFFFIGTSATKSWNFHLWFTYRFIEIRAKKQQGVYTVHCTAPPPHGE